MSYSSFEDSIVSALRRIALNEVNAALMDKTGEDSPAVKSTHAFPTTLNMLGTMETPAMAIYIARQRTDPQGRRRDQLLTINVEYFGPITRLDDLTATWPLLREVWQASLSAFEIGKVGDVDVLGLLGVTWFEDETASVTYDHAAGSDGSFPYFLGTFGIRWRPEGVDLDALAPFTSLFVNLDLYEGPTKTKDNFVTVRGTTT